MVNKDVAGVREVGPEIVLNPCTTGGACYRHSEADRLGE
jgi:hypothetical protein